MNIRIVLPMLIIANLFLKTNAFSQTSEWKKETVDEGKIFVKSLISEKTEGGKALPLIEYIVSTTEKVSYQKCILQYRS